MKIVRLTQPTLRAAFEQVISKCSAEGLTHFAPIQSSRLVPNWNGFLESGDGLVYALLNDTAHAVGILLALKSFDMLTGEKQMLEFLWLVAPSARKGGFAARMLDALEADAKAAGCVRIIAGADARHSPKLMERFYKRRGYEPRVFTYSKVI